MYVCICVCIYMYTFSSGLRGGGGKRGKCLGPPIQKGPPHTKRVPRLIRKNFYILFYSSVK